MSSLILESVTLNQLEDAAYQIIKTAQHRTLWCFDGEMGAGKTTLIQAICKAMGVKGDVTSPTFSLVNEYETSTGNTIYHFDFYRIRSIEEVYDIGYEDYFYNDNVCFIEWPSKISELLANEPVMNITVEKISENSRRIIVD